MLAVLLGAELRWRVNQWVDLEGLVTNADPWIESLDQLEKCTMQPKSWCNAVTAAVGADQRSRPKAAQEILSEILYPRGPQ